MNEDLKQINESLPIQDENQDKPKRQPTNRVKTEFKNFFKTVSEASERIYLMLFTFYIAMYFMLEVAWTEEAEKYVYNIRYALLSCIMWGATIYLFFIICEWKKLWKKTVWLILTAIILLASTGYFAIKMSTNAYGVVFDIVFVVLAYGKSFRKMLRCTLSVVISGLILAGLGMNFGFTMDLGKPETVRPGHSLGISYPNTWGYLLFLALIILWYLYLRYKPVLTFAIFWTAAAFNYNYVLCRTIAGLTIVFPILAVIADAVEKTVKKKIEKGTFKRKRILEGIVIIIPFIALAVMLFSSFQVEWWYQYYHGPLRNLAWRFIQGGLYFKHWGMPLFGNPYRSNVHIYENVCGEFIEVGILDSSFAAYIIMRGLFWLGYTLVWLCIAHWKALKKHDYAIILIETIFLGFAMMERPGLEMWYNFVLLYPLAKSEETSTSHLIVKNEHYINTETSENQRNTISEGVSVEGM